jgi:3-hydroxyacyl-CoA dehydrogenase/enoyl-CoA hydratase/3-hydroxybutyryl-CoA epimerase
MTKEAAAEKLALIKSTTKFDRSGRLRSGDRSRVRRPCRSRPRRPRKRRPWCRTALICSNTSTLPITGLAEASRNAKNFIGLHFFSPVDKMPLVEIIMGKETGDEALAKAFDYVLQIKKTPIVVNDSRGFFTSRVFGTFCMEGVNMLAEG